MSSGPVHVEDEQEMERIEPFYTVQAKNLEESPDPRAKRELALQKLATHIRDFPTIPADPENVSEVWQAALSDEMAVELPTVHCSFRCCSWCGQTEEERDSHILSVHKELLSPIALTLPLCFSEEARLLSVYNQAIAVKTRQGAPVTSFSMQRRSVNNYMKTITRLSLIHI